MSMMGKDYQGTRWNNRGENKPQIWQTGKEIYGTSHPKPVTRENCTGDTNWKLLTMGTGN